jgi:hypothetical protein
MTRRRGPTGRRRRHGGRLVLAFAVACAILALSSSEVLAQGCAMCRTAVEGASDPLSRGISLSVLFMVSMPFAIFTTIAGWLYISHRRAGAGAEIGRAATSGTGNAVAAGSDAGTGRGAHGAAGTDPGHTAVE